MSTTITLQPRLVRQLEQVAVQCSVEAKELVETAVRAYLRQMERETIKAEAAAFRSMHAKLAEKYLGQYVAVHGGEVVDSDEDFQALHGRVRQRFGCQPVLLRQVETEPKRVLTFRSPRLERGQS
jgi:predicted transcriptional regulator